MPDLLTAKKLNVAILMATFNGERWICQQIDSIFNQSQVNITLFISDDCSTDNTWGLLKELAEKDNRIKLLPRDTSFGSAAKNFFRLVQNVDVAHYDYVAFADQDDLWSEDKLISHIELATKNQADGVSSNVVAFWPDGRVRLVNKAAVQRRYDFLFESAGPGCTFLMTPWLVGALRDCLNDEISMASEVALHDWLAYAICRAHGKNWCIDPIPSVNYRQHGSNSLGANTGWQAGWSRIQKMRDGWYRREIVNICKVCRSIGNKAEYADMIALLEPKTYLGNLRLLGRLSQLRRDVKDRLFLAFALLTGLL